MGSIKRITNLPGSKKHYPGVMSDGFWISIGDEETEGTWVDYYTKEEPDIMDAVSGELNGGTVENCALIIIPWGGWQDWNCQINKVVPIQCVCQAQQGQIYLTLRGLCPDSNIDPYYVPRNKYKDGQTVF